MIEVGNLIGDVLEGLVKDPENNKITEIKVLKKVKILCDKFPLYPSINYIHKKD